MSTSWRYADSCLRLKIDEYDIVVPRLITVLLVRSDAAGLTDDPISDLLHLELDLHAYIRHLGTKANDALEEIAYGRDEMRFAQANISDDAPEHQRLAEEYVATATDLHAAWADRHQQARAWAVEVRRFIDIAVDLSTSRDDDVPKCPVPADPADEGAKASTTHDIRRTRRACAMVSPSGPLLMRTVHVKQCWECAMGVGMFSWRCHLAEFVFAGGTVVLLAACSSGATGDPAAGSAGSATPSTSAATPTSPTDSPGQQAMAAYLGMWSDFFDAAATSDWQSPKLGQYATGLALSTMSRGLYADHLNDLVSRGVPTHDAQVSSVDTSANPTSVIITDCSDSTHSLRYRADNGQLADSPGGRRLVHATVQRQSDGSWKVSDFGVQGIGTC
jgi:hypothetical protein